MIKSNLSACEPIMHMKVQEIGLFFAAKEPFELELDHSVFIFGLIETLTITLIFFINSGRKCQPMYTQNTIIFACVSKCTMKMINFTLKCRSSSVFIFRRFNNCHFFQRLFQLNELKASCIFFHFTVYIFNVYRNLPHLNSNSQ